MTVSSEQSSVSYAGDNVTLNFPVPFYFLQNSDLRVSKVSQDGTEVIQSMDTDYTVTGAGNESGGSVTLFEVVGSGRQLIIDRDPPATQETAYQENDPFPAEEHEKALDKLTMLVQRLTRTSFNSLHFPLFEQVDGTLPKKAERLGMVQGYDPVNGAPIMVPIPSSVGAGDRTPYRLVSGIDFMPGATSVTLPRAPNSPGNLEVNWDAAPQSPSTWSVIGQTLNFSTAIPNYITEIWGYIGTTLSILIPPDNSIGDDQLIWGKSLSRVVDSMSELKALDTNRYQRAFSTGFGSAHDGGGGNYRFNETNTAAEVPGLIVAPTVGSGRWELIVTLDLSIKQTGALGTSNDTAGVQAAVDSGYDVYAPPGTYTIDTVYFPDSPSDQVPLGRKFTGTPNTIFQQRTANTPLFKKAATAGRAYGWEIGPFTVQPKAGANSTVAAILTAGFTNTDFIGITGLSNGTTGMWAIITAAASPALSYFNRFIGITLTGQTGWTKGLDFGNNGAGTLYNSNANVIDSPRIYNNPDLVIALDVINSYAISIRDPYIEANPACTAINMGTKTSVRGGALEANGNDFAYADSRAIACTVQDVYLATAHTTTFGAGAVGNLWINVVEVGGNTWAYANSPDASSNRKIQMRKSETPAGPGLVVVSGGGDIALESQAVVSPLDPLTGEVTYLMNYIFTASGTGTMRLALAPITQTPGTPAFAIKSITWGAISTAGTIALNSLALDKSLWLVPPSATDIRITALVTYKQPT